MRPVQVGEVEIDRCESCGGIWLDLFEREKLLLNKATAAAADLRQTPNAALNRKEGGKCPRDHATLIHMVDIKQPHIGFESCNICGGIFFDAGELKDLTEFTLRERLKVLIK